MVNEEGAKQEQQDWHLEEEEAQLKYKTHLEEPHLGHNPENRIRRKNHKDKRLLDLSPNLGHNPENRVGRKNHKRLLEDLERVARIK